LVLLLITIIIIILLLLKNSIYGIYKKNTLLHTPLPPAPTSKKKKKSRKKLFFREIEIHLSWKQQQPPTYPLLKKRIKIGTFHEKKQKPFTLLKNCLQKHVKINKKGEGTLEPLINFAPTCPDLCRPFKKSDFRIKISLFFVKKN